MILIKIEAKVFWYLNRGVKILFAKRKIIFVDGPFPSFSIDKESFNFSLIPFKLV
jgi:hypothetical protein